MKINRLIALMSLVAFSSLSFAAPAANVPVAKVVGTIDAKLPAAKNAHNFSSRPASVKLLKIKLNDKAKAKFNKRLSHMQTHHKRGLHHNTLSDLPSKKLLDMSGVPVLNQGLHGSCVTFAITAAIDAALDKGDYISQLCSLSLGKYLEQYRFRPSGWGGSNATYVLEQINEYGIVTKSDQRWSTCGGYSNYPTDSTDEPSMDLKSFAALSKDMRMEFFTQPIFDFFSYFMRDAADSADKDVIKVKQALNDGYYVPIGFLLDGNVGIAGATGKATNTNDAWVLTDRVVKDMILMREYVLAGHEVVVIGYDDDLELAKPDGTTDKGAFIIRNSWGDEIGDNGNFYMSYEYFKYFADEANVIIPIK